MGVLTEDTKAFVTELFAETDADGSGTINAEEIHTMITKVAEKEGFEAPSQERIQARLDALPTENEGALTLSEFLFLIGAIKVMAICVVLFDAADADGSGVLESSEIKNVLIKLHEAAGADPPSDADMDAMIEKVGGEVTLEQFSAIMIPIIVASLGDPVIE
eukprot:CAMPEP_0202491002 /NCGR_PEP_ID=MMETSP1361-20130828/8215_1 /ASSEMBLY_ACC=CAM_ASM_000849 /TAXON_ID=210615 /ORGANISM="Staurosira complex sp., Strain CCMP2646" /LENGTH=161 /DNA_ID=CAMNT_0049120991 /DNA_START=123 /DNA_END=608 /DNA_ORIENTATION=-